MKRFRQTPNFTRQFPRLCWTKRGEEVERRTEKSRTVVTEDGRYETQFHDVPIHFQDAKGKWQEFDNKLVPSSMSGYAARNSAGDASVQLPKSLAQTPARLEREGRFVQFSLKGAHSPTGQVGNQEQQQAIPESQPVPPQPEQTQIAPSPEQPAVGNAPASPESSTQYDADLLCPIISRLRPPRPKSRLGQPMELQHLRSLRCPALILVQPRRLQPWHPLRRLQPRRHQPWYPLPRHPLPRRLQANREC